MAWDPTTLELFLRVAALGAIGRAGREFGLSSTASTQRIKALEADLGVTLFNRTTRAVALTADGEVFLEHARRIVASIEDARSDVAGKGAPLKGELRVTGSASFGRRYLAPGIAEFLRLHPQVRVRLELSDGIVDIVEQGFDLALRIGTLPSSSLVARRLADNPRLLVASPRYLAEAGAPDTPAGLARHQCLVLGENRRWRLRDRAGVHHEVRVAGAFATNYGEVVTEAARAGAGIALKSLWDVHDLLDDGALVPVLPEHRVEPLWSLWAVRPPGQSAPARVRAFIDFMAKRFASIAPAGSAPVTRA